MPSPINKLACCFQSVKNPSGYSTRAVIGVYCNCNSYVKHTVYGVGVHRMGVHRVGVHDMNACITDIRSMGALHVKPGVDVSGMGLQKQDCS
jgi:hypothetical protein